MEKLITSKNGIKVYSYKNQALHSFHISLFLRAGAMFEAADENGITHFLEHISIRNVNKIMSGGLYTTLDKLGLEFNASSFSEMVQFYMSGASKNFRPAANIFAKLLSPIALEKSEIDAERTANVLLDEFRGCKIGRITLEEPETAVANEENNEF